MGGGRFISADVSDPLIGARMALSGTFRFNLIGLSKVTRYPFWTPPPGDGRESRQTPQWYVRLPEPERDHFAGTVAIMRAYCVTPPR